MLARLVDSCEVRGGCVRQPHELADVAERLLALELAHEGREEDLLRADAGDVAAVADAVAAAEERQRALALQRPGARIGKVDARVRVDDGAIGADVDTADRIRHLDDADELDEPGELDVETGQVLHRVHGAGEAAVVEGDVDRLGRPALRVAVLVHAVRDRHEQVAREADCDRVRLVLRDVQQDVDVVEHATLILAADALRVLAGV